MTPKEHANNLAKRLEELLAVDWLAGHGETILEVANARKALEAWACDHDANDQVWCSAGVASRRLGVTDKTLKRWRDSGQIAQALHWRRKGPSSHCVYNVPALEQKMAQWAG